MRNIHWILGTGEKKELTPKEEAELTSTDIGDISEIIQEFQRQGVTVKLSKDRK